MCSQQDEGKLCLLVHHWKRTTRMPLWFLSSWTTIPATFTDSASPTPSNQFPKILGSGSMDLNIVHYVWTLFFLFSTEGKDGLWEKLTSPSTKHGLENPAGSNLLLRIILKQKIRHTHGWVSAHTQNLRVFQSYLRFWYFRLTGPSLVEKNKQI